MAHNDKSTRKVSGEQFDAPQQYTSAVVDKLRVSRQKPQQQRAAIPSDSAASYVYPVRSLLSDIQPAQKKSPQDVLGATGVHPNVEGITKVTTQPRIEKEVIDAVTKGALSMTSQVKIPFPGEAVSSNSKAPLNPSSGGYFPPASFSSSKTSTEASSKSLNETALQSSNVEYQLYTSNSDSGLPSGAETVDSKRVVILPGDRDTNEYNPRHPEPISSAGAEVIATAYTSPSLVVPRPLQSSTSSQTSQSIPLDFSKTGIVHLPPLPFRGGSDRGSSASGNYAESRRGSASESGPAAAFSGSDSAGDSAGEMVHSDSGMSTTSSELVRFKFEHVQDDNGFHVVTGREGTFTKCEDEPIHAPGAVQGFGVLIALEEADDSGNLVVRQVSEVRAQENATELLGLSPQYLFGLECFTQTLPDSQADLLWDNVQFLNDSEYESESETNDNPQVFLLSGWGEPGSVLSEDEEEQVKGSDRRFWTCWCAAHRPPMHTLPVTKDLKGNSTYSYSIIILEFELERDLYNPLYPPFQMEIMSVGSPDSQGSSYSSGVSSGSSTATTLSGGSGSTTEMNIASPGSTAVGGTTPYNESGPSSDDGYASGSTSLPSMINAAEIFLSARQGLEGDEQWFPTPEDVFESTTSHSKPLKALERMRRINRTFTSPASERAGGRSGNFADDFAAQTARQRARARRGGSQAGVGTMDIFAVLAQVNDQLGSAPDLESFLKVVVGVIKDLTQFHRVLVYQFDDQWNGQVVSELVDWRQTRDLYKGLHFPATDIPAQARELYKINKVRLLYNRSQTTARLVVRSREDLENPLDMTHSFLRAMSPIHIKYLANMGVRSSMSISIVTFGALWGLISCHSYGVQGMRVSFPVRQMLRLLSDSVSRNIERLSYAQRLHTRKLISTLPTDSHPTGYIVSNAEDLLGLFDADFGVLVIGEGAKILGPNEHGQEILLVAEYLRLKQYTLMQVSQSVTRDFPDLELPSGLEVIAGLLYVPLSRGGKDFIAFLRRGQLRDVHWAGKPYKDDDGSESVLEPRKSFKTWSETIAGRCRAWTEECMETAGVLALVYGKFIEVWRQKESALQTTQLTNLILSNASHEVRTPLNHIINYLEMALNGPLDIETRENLSRSHSASKSLLFTINDLLDLTRLESGNETSFNETFDLHEAIAEAVQLYRNEATRRNIHFDLDVIDSPKMVIGDAKKIRTVVANLTANAVKYTTEGTVTVSCHRFKEPRGLRNLKEIAVEIVVGDTGCGIESEKLESIFREFEQVESAIPRSSNLPGLGLGLAIVARIVEQLGGQLRVDSKPQEGSRFSFLIPFELASEDRQRSISPTNSTTSNRSLQTRSRTSSDSSEIDSIVEALSYDCMKKGKRRSSNGQFEVVGSRFPIKSLKMDEFDVDKAVESAQINTVAPTPRLLRASPSSASDGPSAYRSSGGKLRVLVDDHINRSILSKRLSLDGHTVVGTTNGQEGVEAIQNDCDYDCILMDIQMPILNGFEAAKAIRVLEKNAHTTQNSSVERASKRLNGRVPIFAVSASLFERQRIEMIDFGMDGWILKPIDFKRLRTILKGVLDPDERQKAVYREGCSWELGGWLEERSQPPSL
ncbi:hypothetical protein EW145_g1296 [Phellinidium pouzarii]|uniref:Uncharacterized protein n=1 Tax=Phellinidium pouzarii TaxID=167371 RepID=A0A4S4LGT8_9AGAM|nr:hypothetical protein EW145_g1296 [Phellinidium pouzarii]